MATRSWPEICAAVIDQAVEDAASFVEEFGEPLDSATTDWDATAWSIVASDLKLQDECDTEELENLWDLYRNSLVFLTKKAADLPQDDVRGNLRKWIARDTGEFLRDR